MPVFFMASFISLEAGAFFALTQSALSVPVVLIGNSISNVFFPEVSRRIRDGGNYKRLVLKASGCLFLLSLTIFVFFILWGSEIFQYVFGSEWARAGEYSRWLSIWFIFWLSTRPYVDCIPALGLQRSFLKIEVFSLITKMASLVVGTVFWKDDIVSIIIFSFSSIVFNLITMYIVICNKEKSRFGTQAYE